MKRIATAAVAATLSLTAVANPAFAAEEKVGSSDAYRACKVLAQAGKEDAFDGLTDAQKREVNAELRKQTGSSTPTGLCLQGLFKSDEYKGGAIALFTLVPLAIVALLGAGAAYAGLIPGVALPALPF